MKTESGGKGMGRDGTGWEGRGREEGLEGGGDGPDAVQPAKVMFSM